MIYWSVMFVFAILLFLSSVSVRNACQKYLQAIKDEHLNESQMFIINEEMRTARTLLILAVFIFISLRFGKI